MDMGMAMVTTMASDLLKPSQDMDIMAIDMVWAMVMDTILAMDMVDMDFMDSMARDLLSQDMDTMVVDMDMDTMDMAMDTMDTMARDLLMPSQDMDIMATDMDTMDMVMAMVMDSMVKQICCSFLEFSTNEVDQRDPVKRNTLFIQLK